MTSFATPTDLTYRLRQNVDTNAAQALLDDVAAEIRALTGQTITAVTDDVVVLRVEPDLWRLILPQRPAQNPTVIAVEGTELTTWKWDGIRTVTLDPFPGQLSSLGWYDYDYDQPRPNLQLLMARTRSATVTYSHGSDDAAWLALAKRVNIAAALRLYDNPLGDKADAIDDFSRTRGDAPAVGSLTQGEADSLEDFYGMRATSVALGR